MSTKRKTQNLDLVEVFKKYEKEHGPIKEPNDMKTDLGKPKGREVW